MMLRAAAPDTCCEIIPLAREVNGSTASASPTEVNSGHVCAATSGASDGDTERRCASACWRRVPLGGAAGAVAVAVSSSVSASASAAAAELLDLRLGFDLGLDFTPPGVAVVLSVAAPPAIAAPPATPTTALLPVPAEATLLLLLLLTTPTGFEGFTSFASFEGFKGFAGFEGLKLPRSFPSAWFATVAAATAAAAAVRRVVGAMGAVVRYSRLGIVLSAARVARAGRWCGKTRRGVRGALS